MKNENCCKENTSADSQSCSCSYGKAMMCSHGGHFLLLRWAIGVCILVAVFWLGFQLAVMTSYPNSGWDGVSQYGPSWYPTSMMHQYGGGYNDFGGPNMMYRWNGYANQNTQFQPNEKQQQSQNSAPTQGDQQQGQVAPFQGGGKFGSGMMQRGEYAAPQGQTQQ